jgi:hypothetical protein|tara:strand:- start:70 stop:249 length:180 start_codon:yes stop_codon:yes gene_type:complete
MDDYLIVQIYIFSMFVCGGTGYGIYNDNNKNPYTGLIIGVLIGLGLGFIAANIFERFII